MIKQVIIIRKDLNMRKGKMCAQAAHASMKVITDCIDWNSRDPFTDSNPTISLNGDTMFWLQGTFTKIVVGVDSEEELIELYCKANIMNIPCSIIEDCGITEFHGVPTKTAVAIGPAKEEIINAITSHLKLL